MNNRRMLLKILGKSLSKRRTRIASAAIAVLLGISLISAFGTIFLDARSKVGRELRAYGGNIALSPKTTEMAIGAGGLTFGTVKDPQYLRESDLNPLKSDEIAPHLVGYVPYLYGVVETNDHKIVLAGTLFDQVKAVSPWWQVTGTWIGNQEDTAAMIGVNVAKALGLDIGQNITLRYENKLMDFLVVGIVETGAAEDSQVFVNLGAAQRFLQKDGYVSLVQVSALTEKQPISTTAAYLRETIPSAKVAILSQVADAESSVTGRVELLLLVVSALVLLASALTVSSTMMTAVLERTKEIGLMKALGASETHVALVFLTEAVAIGCVGGFFGFFIGIAVANIAGQTVFGAAISINPLVFPVSLGTAVAVSLFASILPVKRATRIDPAITLRGE